MEAVVTPEVVVTPEAVATPVREGRLFFIVIDSLIGVGLLMTAIALGVLCIAALSV